MGEAPRPAPQVKAHPTARVERALGIAIAGFGAYISITSAVGISLGVHAGEGWLAILYGGLGVSMGAAGVAALWITGMARAAFLGWFLVGIASRAVVEGGAYGSVISIPIAAGVLIVLAFELLNRPSAAGTVGAALGGSLALGALGALAITAPSLPAICQPDLRQGTSGSLFLYPGDTAPFDVAEAKYLNRCYAPYVAPKQ